MSSVSPLPGFFGKVNPRHHTLIKNLGITFFENVMTKGLSFLTILMLTRTLGPAEYGKYSFIFVTVATCSALFDFGMENTAVRFAAREKDKSESIFGLYLSVKLATLLVLVLFFAVGGSTVFHWMNKGSIARFLPFLLVGLIGESLFFVNDTWLQANRQFQFRAILNITRFSLALIYVWILLTGNWLVLDHVFYIYAVPLVFSVFFVGRYVSFLKNWFTRRLDPSLFKEILNYEQWMFTFSIAGNLLTRVDFFMLGFWVGFEQLGIYNAAVQLCAVVSFLPLAMGKVLLPTLADKREPEIFRFTNKMQKPLVIMVLGIALLTPLAQWVVPALLGHEYGASVVVLEILLLAFLFSLVTTSYEQALYSLGKPRIMSVGRYAQLGILVLLNWLTIPIFGIYGAAMAAVVGRALYLVFIHRYYCGCEREVFARERNLQTAPSAKMSAMEPESSPASEVVSDAVYDASGGSSASMGPLAVEVSN